MFSIHFREFVAFAFGRVTPSTGGLIISRFAGSIAVLSRSVGRSFHSNSVRAVHSVSPKRWDLRYGQKKTFFLSRLCVSLVSLLLGTALVRSIPCFSLGASHCPMCRGSLSNLAQLIHTLSLEPNICSFCLSFSKKHFAPFCIVSYRIASLRIVLFYIVTSLLCAVLFCLLYTHSVNMVIFIFVRHFFNDASSRQSCSRC